MRVRLLDRLIIRELIGPWFMGVMLFTVLLMAATYLLRLTELIVAGIGVMSVLKLSILYIPYLLVKTFPMSMLLSSILAFGRLSNDSELIALTAGGASLFNIMRPVAIFGICISILTFAFGEYFVPSASTAALKLQNEVAREKKSTTAVPYYTPLTPDGVVRGGVMAKDVDISARTMKDVTASWYEEDGSLSWLMFAREMTFSDEGGWQILNGTIIKRQDGRIITVDFERSGPPEGVEFDFTPKSILAQQRKDPDAQSLSEIQESIDLLRKQSGNTGEKMKEVVRKVRDLQVAYWSKFSVALSCLVFALVGAPAGIRRTRQTTGAGVTISVAIIFVYYILYNYLNILARGGVLPPAFSAFLPVVIGLVAAIALFSQKNR